jgi:hypothetical protein
MKGKNMFDEEFLPEGEDNQFELGAAAWCLATFFTVGIVFLIKWGLK